MADHCTCSTEYDSVNGDMNHDYCDWCCEEDASYEDCCYCEYSYDRDGRYLDYECDKCAAASGVIRPTYVVAPKAPWADEKETIAKYLSRIEMGATAQARVELTKELFLYIQTIKPFMTQYPTLQTATMVKVRELKGDPLTVSIADVLASTEAFLNSL